MIVEPGRPGAPSSRTESTEVEWLGGALDGEVHSVGWKGGDMPKAKRRKSPIFSVRTCPHCGKKTRGPAHFRHEQACRRQAGRGSTATGRRRPTVSRRGRTGRGGQPWDSSSSSFAGSSSRRFSANLGSRRSAAVASPGGAGDEKETAGPHDPPSSPPLPPPGGRWRTTRGLLAKLVYPGTVRPSP